MTEPAQGRRRTPARALRGRTALAFLLTLLAGLLISPASAGDTEQELKEAKAKLEKLQSEANAATAEYDAAYSRYITTKDQITEAQAEINLIKGRMKRIDGRLGERAREAYQMGATGVLDLLFGSESIADFSDRVVFLDKLAEDDADLMVRADVLTEDLNRLEADLKRLADRQADTVKVLQEKKALVYEKLEEAQALREELEDKLAREIAAARRAAAAQAASRSSTTAVVVSGGALQACPVPGSSFSDTWGAPRSGGRSHQGVDMMAPYGTPIHAAQSGSVSFSSSSLGGLQAYVHANNGDVTFYAHMQSYEGGARSVSAGEVIGYVGDSGNATGTPHLHFEYHPGGGGAVNPYPYVVAVC